MCRGMSSEPSGVPITRAMHDRFPQEVQEAWEKFDRWIRNQAVRGEDGKISRADMPEEIKAAWELMNNSPIPEPMGLEAIEIAPYWKTGAIGVDSCYVKDVTDCLKD